MSTTSLLLGDDGGGYELACKLESRGVWRTWLGDSIYSSTFIHLLSSPAVWDSFMHPPSAADTPIHLLQLQLRVRALLFDKASASLFTSSPLASSAQLSALNPTYLELHGDDLYFTLENGAQDADQRWPASNASSSKGQAKTSIGSGELPETWYSQFIERYKASKSYRLMSSDRESEKRTPEQMSTYLRVLENHKRRRVAFKDISNPRSNLITDNDMVDDMLFFPETMFTLNCVPDGAVLKISEPRNSKKMQFNGVLDNLPQIMTKIPMINPIMIERLGIKPEYLSMDQTRGNDGSKGEKKLLGQEQAAQMSQKVVVRLLNNVGFESSSAVPLEIFTQFLSSHISKLGGKLKLLADSYKQQCSAIELIKMFLQTTGHRNLGPLAELVKDNTRNIVQQTQQVQGIQAQMQPQQQPIIQQAQQQNLRHLSPQMQMHLQQMNNPQFIAYQQQQQWERMRKRQQQSTPRPGTNMNTNMNIDKDRSLVQVKMEKNDMPLDTNAFTTMNSRHPHFQQLRQQQLAAMSLHAQTNNQFRAMSPLQLQQLQSMNMGMTRAQPVKVEGFQELMGGGGGGDSSMKHDSDENKMLSPPQQ